MKIQQSRWLGVMALFCFGPLVFVNVVGMPSSEGFIPRHRHTFGLHHWLHGWPIVAIDRSSITAPPYYFGGSKPDETMTIDQLQLQQSVRPNRQRSLTSSRWPIGDEKQRVVFWWRIPINAFACCVLLFGAGVNIAHSRFVQTGRLQTSLATMIVASIITAVYFGIYPRVWYFGWEHLPTVPIVSAAILGWLQVGRWWLGRVGKGVRNQ